MPCGGVVDSEPSVSVLDVGLAIAATLRMRQVCTDRPKML